MTAWGISTPGVHAPQPRKDGVFQYYPSYWVQSSASPTRSGRAQPPRILRSKCRQADIVDSRLDRHEQGTI